MKKNFKAEGIILRKIDFNEADRIITVLTKNFGKVDFFAKGGRRLKSKFCGRLELLNTVEITAFSSGKDLCYLKEINTLNSIRNAKSTDQYRLLFYFAEITQRLIQTNQNIEGVYQLTKETLTHLSHEHRLDVLLHTYLVKLLSKIGFLPHWNICSDCHEKLNLNQKVYLSEADGHLRCEYCANSFDTLIKNKMVKWVNFMQNYDFNQIFKVNISKNEGKKTWEMIQKVIRNLLNYPLKSEVFLRA